MMALFELDDITFSHNPTLPPVMDGFSLSIEKGLRTAILGANGAGKTTFFYTLLGVNKPQKGCVLYNGNPIDYSKEGLRSLRSEVAVVLQNPDEQIFCSLVEEDVAFGPLNLGMSTEDVEARVAKALADVRLSGLERRPLQQLSGGQRKRVAIAGALALDPRVMIMDEPTAGLDPQASMEVMELAEKLSLRGVTVLISTHDVDLAYRWSEVSDVLCKGKIAHTGDAESFYTDAVKVHSCGLLAPSVFSINREVSAMRGNDPAPFPRCPCELLAKFGGSKRSGKVVLIPSGPEEAADRMDSTLNDMKGACSCIYGSDVRHALEGRDIDFAFDGVNACLSRAVEGKDSVLLYDKIYDPLIRGQIERLRTFGFDTEAVL